MKYVFKEARVVFEDSTLREPSKIHEIVVEAVIEEGLYIKVSAFPCHEQADMTIETDDISIVCSFWEGQPDSIEIEPFLEKLKYLNWPEVMRPLLGF
ncbi:MAG: hypothetical protein ACRCYY_14565 [Trueperaceae bacterium]